MTESRSDREFVSSIGLVITDIDLVPSNVTVALGLVPDDSWRRGDAKRVGNKLHDWGGWKKWLPSKYEGDPFAEELKAWVALLGGRAAELRKLQDAGYKCELDCFVSVSGSALVEMAPALQRDLAELGVHINITIDAG
ncbi:DUF4279 domain-containing protein [Polaromonas sp.]|uniref:DUF4279 domain-containing protein n=1 Tax=Polaromonas sp. TaxID=1869339 RepID=UPI0024882BFD|nr:DUF4279 domain-containing protein [Polaromonas sp.]MDI1273986.1 DUF4279 domain-containing protein [Polaromonas sp.]